MVALTEDLQVAVGELLLGPGTPYRLLDFNPWVKTVRAPQEQDRAWNHGSWSGAEWANKATVPLRILVRGSQRTTSEWLQLQQQLAAAFAPTGDAGSDRELRWRIGGGEYLMRGRPRMVEPSIEHIGDGLGYAFTQCAFVAPDPRIYSGDLHTTAPIPLPQQVGGLTVPFTVPFTVAGVLVGGSEQVTNAGTTDTGLFLRIDGPVSEPRVTLKPPSGDPLTLRFLLDLPAGQWLEVDTAARTVFLNGLATASRRGQTVADPDWPLLPPGTSTLRFNAADFDDGTLTTTFRDAWW